MSEKRILLAVNKFSYPPVDGGTAAVASLVDLLSKIGKVSVFTPDTPKNTVKNEISNIEVHSFPIDTEKNRKRFLFQQFFIPLQALQYIDENGLSLFRRLVEEFVPDVIITNTPFLSLLIEKSFPGLKYILRSENIEYKIWEYRSEVSAEGFTEKIKFKVYSRIVKRYETKVWQKAEKILHISQRELTEIIQAIGNSQKVHYLPYAFPDTFFEQVKYIDYNDIPRLYFIGAFDWAPNFYSMVKFLSEEWEKIVTHFPSIQYIITGKKVELLRRYFGGRILKNVVLLDSPPSPIIVIKNSDILLSPVKWGSGVSIKVLEALAAGRCVIATVESARDIHIGRECGLATYSTTDELIEHLSFFIDKRIRRKAGEKAKEYMINNHSYRSVMPLLHSLL